MNSHNSSETDQDRWRQIEELYESAARMDSSEREAFLARACAGDEELRQELLSLLSSDDQQDSFLEEPALNLGLALLEHRPEALIGQSIDRYRLIKLLGRGGMGEVYLAHDPRLNRHVALKLLPASITDDHERARRFMQEAQAASATSHPNVAHIYEIGEAQERHYITMEYIAGTTLRRLLQQGALDVAKALDIAIQVITALAAAHQAGVIHRDIKPENIMLRDDGYVKVLDFGLAKLSESRPDGSETEEETLISLHTEPGLLMGTSYYMSPEQVRRQNVDGRADLWSVGVVLYEMLAGQRPFLGQGVSEIIIAILEQQPEPLGQRRPGLPTSLQNFVDRALRKKPDERYQSVEVMLADLRRIKRQIDDGQPAFGGRAPDELLKPLPPPAHDKEPQATAEPRDPSTGELGRQTEYASRFTYAPAADREHSSRLFPQMSWPIFTGAALLLMLLVGSGLYLRLSSRRPSSLQSRNFNLQFQRLYISGNINDIVISPDGKYVASIVAEEGKQTIHITERATSSDLRIVPPSERGYSGLSFSPDGNYIYYLENLMETGTLYRVSKLGGGQRKLLNNVNSPVTFSPDGKRIAFIRYNIPRNTMELITASSEGSDEQLLVERRSSKDKDVFTLDTNGVGPAWSPDGKALACATINRSRNPQEMNVELIALADGASRHFNAAPWYDISRIVWLADGSGLIVAATASPTAPWQLSLLSFPGGEARKLTNDPNNYSRVSSTVDSSLLLTLNIEENPSIWLISLEGEKGFVPFNIRQKKGVSEIVWAPDGKLIYTVNEAENLNLWIQDAEGNATRQLTFEQNKNFRPTISPDGRYIVFVSSRAGAPNIWRMDLDGMQLRQITSGRYEDMPSVTADGKWVIYRTENSISKVSIDGGNSLKLLDKSALYPTISPDGRRLAFFNNERPDSQRWHLEVVELASLAPVSRFLLPEPVVPFNGLRWTPDGTGLIYVSNSDGAANLWMQPLKGDGPKQLTDFRDAEILSFAWSPNLRQIACVRNTKTYIPVLIKPF